jgi:microcystin-dependent protein
MNRIDTSQPNGFPLKADATLGFMQQAYSSAINALAKLAVDGNVIISGCIDNGATVSDGWVLFQDELFYFQGGTKSVFFVIDEQIQADNNQNGTSVNRYFTRTLKFGAGANSYSFASLQRVETLVSLVQKNAATYGEPSVILSGCDVSNVNNGVLDISPGTLMLNGKYYNAPAYTGSYPVYFTAINGIWENNANSPDDIAFTPWCSQYLKLVNKRNVTSIGEILMQIVDISDFDSSGLGQWIYKGFALCNGNNGTLDMRGRVPMGHDDRLTDPSNGIWSAEYNVLATVGGEKEHSLSIDEMPRHNHQPNDGGDPNGAVYQPSLPGGYGLIQKTVTGQNRVASSLTTTGSGTKPDVVTTPALVPFQGADQAHENRPPFMVLAYIQRI